MPEALWFEIRNANTNMLESELSSPCNEKRSLFIHVLGSENVYSDVLRFIFLTTDARTRKLEVMGRCPAMQPAHSATMMEKSKFYA